MKQTKAAGMILGLVLGLVMAKSSVLALTIPNIKVINLVPTATPTPLLIKKIGTDLNLQLIPTTVPTAIPTLKLIKLPSNLKPIVTLEATVIPTKAIVTVSPTAAVSPEISPMVTTTGTDQPAAVDKGTNNMTFWFLVVTIGLLAIIIIVQAWPKKDNEE